MPCKSSNELYGLITCGDLRRCIDSKDLQLHYQPVIDLVSAVVFGVEVVLHWQHQHLD
jgi:sensor c-di-GMP phosphodiesterase-like protein